MDRLTAYRQPERAPSDAELGLPDPRYISRIARDEVLLGVRLRQARNVCGARDYEPEQAESRNEEDAISAASLRQLEGSNGSPKV